MKKRTLQEYLAILVILLVAAGISWAGSQGSISYALNGPDAAGWPVFALCGAGAFLVNWIAFVPAYVFQTERYFDLMGSLTYLSIVAVVLLLGIGGDPRKALIAICISIWAMRLGSFLFLRIREDGSDGRFDRIKPVFSRLLMTWTLQGLWVFLTISCGLAAMLSVESVPLGVPAILGTLLWIVGFALETIADRQKRAFRHDPANEGRFITTGLWSWSQHPNYFGEILLWVGIAVMAWPALAGWQYVTLISPVFVFVLLTRISGIPLLEARSNKKWGDDAEYQAYRARTSVLWPRPW